MGATEEGNMIETSRLIAQAALLRKESRGGHFRRDFPRPKRKWRDRHIEW
jgi:L-aspartate oxidase